MSDDATGDQSRRAPSRRTRSATGSVLLVVGALLLAACGSDDAGTGGADDTSTIETSAATSVAEPAATDPTPDDTAADETTEPAATVPDSSEPRSTEPLATDPVATGAPATPAGWQSSGEPLPPLAYIACCATNWEGEPSPAVAADATGPLAPGIYNAQATPDAGGEPDSGTDGVLSIDVRPYDRCANLGEFDCNDPFTDDELGVADQPARTIELDLDDRVRVGMAGFACGDDGTLTTVTYTGTGAELEALSIEADAAYDSVVAGAIAAGTDPIELATELGATPAGGFADPGCQGYGTVAWTSASGPTILARNGLARLGDDNATFEAHPSAIAQWLTPTAVAVDDAGNVTLYLYGGFLS